MAFEDKPTAGAHASGKRSGKRKGIIPLTVLLVVLVCGALAGTAYIVWQHAELDRAAQEAAETPEPAPAESDAGDETQAEEAAKPENPIDFATLQSENPEIYAWVYIPGTKVNVPVLQSATDDSFYLNHNEKGEYAVEGAAFTQLVNATDFSDPVTLIYGHQTANDTMFTTLHYFENEEFFAQHDTMYIYTYGRILTYKIVAAYQYDDRHIMNSFDFSDPQVLESYYASVLDPTSVLVNVREGAQLTADDRIVQLSTCMDAVNRDNTRYLVTGVLVDEQETQ